MILKFQSIVLIYLSGLSMSMGYNKSGKTDGKPSNEQHVLNKDQR